ncbi:MAG: penicillin-binding protein activator [Succinivibrionaceae bacterium]|nr:penicillin-binding protein activator [Succinivibrionaceae bacterium]
MKLIKSLSPLLLAAMLASGCTSTGGLGESDGAEQERYSAFSAITHPSSWYRELFDSADSGLQHEYSILVARSYIKEKNYEKAKLWLKFAREHSLTQLQESKVHLATAYLYYSQQMYQKSLEELKSVYVRSMSRLENANYYVILANTQNRMGSKIEAYHNYVALNQFIEETDSATLLKNQKAIVTLLMDMSQSQRDQIRNSGRSDLDVGYVEFAENRLIAGEKADKQWLDKYPDHPAQLLVGTRLAAPSGSNPVKFSSDADISHIAVIMPFSGKLASYGDAFRQGIIMAQREKGLTSSIRYYDSNTADIGAVYNQAVNDGAGFVIGPLTKENVSKVISGGVQVPTLAINSFDNISADNAYFFALTPENEGAQAAKKIRRDGHHTPLLLVPNTEKGSRIINGFRRQWTDYFGDGGDIVIRRFLNKQDASNAIDTGLTGTGVDAIYVCGSALEVSMLKEEINGKFEGDYDFYITSNSNPGNLRASVTRKMKDINIGDMPWLLDDYDLKSDISDNLDSSNLSVLTFFALGYDSVSVAPELSSMAGSRRSVDGLTGTITVDPDGKLVTGFKWVRIP